MNLRFIATVALGVALTALPHAAAYDTHLEQLEARDLAVEDDYLGLTSRELGLDDDMYVRDEWDDIDARSLDEALEDLTTRALQELEEELISRSYLDAIDDLEAREPLSKLASSLGKKAFRFAGKRAKGYAENRMQQGKGLGLRKGFNRFRSWRNRRKVPAPGGQE
ncbi:hypothetical protein FA15DRAFT_660540 [Coprinopsis marcescibilis]|uniref:Uncharacterized protein n=1 Tax=Coprinopsis marcescibilis TaxID=230819 RepID=A0A5C3KET3_COPMA|nr:hypothetical protein FA15DRAFT_660540 [Coprinopsis marcescibilis]